MERNLTNGKPEKFTASDADAEIRSLKIEMTLILTCLSILVLGIIIAYLYAVSKFLLLTTI